MKPQLTLIPQLTIHPDKLFLHYESSWSPYKPLPKDKPAWSVPSSTKYAHLLSGTNATNGIVSKIAKRKINRAIDYLLLMSSTTKVHSNYSGRFFNFKVGFITLTLPSKQIHTDAVIKEKCLNQFLVEIRKRYHVKNYVWRAELQKNKNIHFHIIVDKFIYWNELRNRWNRIINKLGYVDRYRENMHEYHSKGFTLRTDLLDHWSKEAQYKAYIQGRKTDFNNPNSTDIHSIQKIHNIKLYISKYLTKNEKKESETVQEHETRDYISGRIWSCNEELSNIKGARVEVDNDLQKEIEFAQKVLTPYEINEQYFSIYFIDIFQLHKIGCLRLYKIFVEYLFNEFAFNQNLSIPF